MIAYVDTSSSIAMDFDEVSFVDFLGEAKVDKPLLFVILVVEISLSSVGIAVAVEAYVSEAT